MTAKLLDIDNLKKEDIKVLIKERMEELGINQAEVARRAGFAGNDGKHNADRVRKALSGSEPYGIDFLKMLFALEIMPFRRNFKIGAPNTKQISISSSTWESIMSKEVIESFFKAEVRIQKFEELNGDIQKDFRTLVIAMIAQLFGEMSMDLISDPIISLAISAAENEARKLLGDKAA